MLLYQTEVVTILNKALKQSAKIRKGTDAVYFCPVCKHYKRKLEINTVTGKYHCWVCGLSGTSLKTLFKKLGLSGDYLSQIYKNTESYRKLPQNDISAILEIFSEKKTDVVEQLMMPKEFRSFYDEELTLVGRHALKYLKSRNITKYDVLRYSIGYCEGGQFHGRVLIPSYDSSGHLNFYSTRSVFEDAKMKYVNSFGSKDIIGFEMFLDYNQPITLVEGAFDAIAIRNNAVPLFGKTLSNKLKSALICNTVPKVNIVLDNDALADSIRISEFLLKNSIETRLVKLDGKDPSEIGFAKTWELIENTPVLDFESLFRLKLSI
jgi:DNA primase